MKGTQTLKSRLSLQRIGSRLVTILVMILALLSIVVAQTTSEAGDRGAKPEPQKSASFDGRCPICLREHKKSNVYPRGSTATLMGSVSYYDPEGKFHHDDPNIVTADYSCSNGHSFSVKQQRGREWIEESTPLSTDATLITGILSPGSGTGQTTFVRGDILDSNRCPEGQKYWPGLSTTSMVTEGGCYSLAEYERISNAFGENLCGETGFAWMTWDKQGRMSGHSENHEWKNGRCHVTYVVWKDGKKRATKSTEEFYRWTCSEVYTYEGDRKVWIYPKPEWAECRAKLRRYRAEERRFQKSQRRKK